MAKKRNKEWAPWLVNLSIPLIAISLIAISRFFGADVERCGWRAVVPSD